MPSSAARRSESIVGCGNAARPSAISSARSRCAPGGDDLGDHAPVERLAGLDHPPGEDHLQRPAHADDPRQPLGAAVDQRHAEAPLGEPEPARLGGDPQVAPQRQLEPAREAPARDRGDRRLRGAQPGEAERPVGALVEPGGDRGLAASGVASSGCSPRKLCARSANAFRSAPAQNASGPSPVSTSARASSSASKRWKPSSSVGRGLVVDRVAALRAGDRQHRGRAAALVADLAHALRAAQALELLARALLAALEPDLDQRERRSPGSRRTPSRRRRSR